MHLLNSILISILKPFCLRSFVILQELILIAKSGMIISQIYGQIQDIILYILCNIMVATLRYNGR